MTTIYVLVDGRWVAAGVPPITPPTPPPTTPYGSGAYGVGPYGK